MARRNAEDRERWYRDTLRTYKGYAQECADRGDWDGLKWWHRAIESVCDRKVNVERIRDGCLR